jgi:hypothetical protein
MLGQMSARLSIPALRAALKDTEPRVVLAATHALYTLGDSTASGVYIAIRTRRQPVGAGKILLRAVRKLWSRERVIKPS